jgi:hypothetical protein
MTYMDYSLGNGPKVVQLIKNDVNKPIVGKISQKEVESIENDLYGLSSQLSLFDTHFLIVHLLLCLVRN